MPDILLGFFKEFFESFLIGLRQKFEAVFAEQHIAQIALRALAFHNQWILALAGQVRIIAVKQDSAGIHPCLLLLQALAILMPWEMQWE